MCMYEYKFYHICALFVNHKKIKIIKTYNIVPDFELRQRNKLSSGAIMLEFGLDSSNAGTIFTTEPLLTPEDSPLDRS